MRRLVVLVVGLALLVLLVGATGGTGTTPAPIALKTVQVPSTRLLIWQSELVVTATCPPGFFATGGGYDADGADVEAAVPSSYGYSVTFANRLAHLGETVTAIVSCARVAGG